VEYNATQMKFDDSDIGEINYSEVLDYYNQKYVESRVNLNNLLKDVSTLTDEYAAGIAQDFSTLTEEQMSQIATQNKEGVWELK
jgi:hypothetical protein